VVDWGLVVWALLLQNIIEHAGASRVRSRAFSGRVDREGLVLAVVMPLHARLAVRLLPLLTPLVLLLEFLGLAALHGRVIHSLAFLAVEDGPHRLLARSKAAGDVEQLVGVDRRAPPELAHEVPAGCALKEGVHNLGLGYAREFSTALGKAPYEVPERLAGLLGARLQVLGVPRTHVRALEVPHEHANQVVPVVNLTGR
jgi:hypothetical protein